MKHFTVIEFLHEKICLDYPKKLPIPRIGEVILFNDYNGWVVDITHNIQGNVSETRIKSYRSKMKKLGIIKTKEVLVKYANGKAILYKR